MEIYQQSILPSILRTNVTYWVGDEDDDNIDNDNAEDDNSNDNNDNFSVKAWTNETFFSFKLYNGQILVWFFCLIVIDN